MSWEAALWTAADAETATDGRSTKGWRATGISIDSRTLKPGDLIVIPKGTAHGGTKPDGRTFKAIAIKTPPQAAGDTTPLN